MSKQDQQPTPEKITEAAMCLWAAYRVGMVTGESSTNQGITQVTPFYERKSFVIAQSAEYAQWCLSEGCHIGICAVQFLAKIDREFTERYAEFTRGDSSND